MHSLMVPDFAPLNNLENYIIPETISKNHENEYKEMENALDNGLILQEEYDDKIIEINKRRGLEETQIYAETKQKELDAEKEFQQKLDNIVKTNLNKRLQEFRDYQTAISNLDSKTPVKNKWGYINQKKTDEQNKEILKSYQTLYDNIYQEKMNLQKQFDDGIISADTLQNNSRELDRLSEDLVDKISNVTEELSDGRRWENLIQKINAVVQVVGQSLQQILPSIWDYQDSIYDAKINELQDFIDKYEDKLDDLEDIIKEHSSNVNDIEDELATARGDRREHLIDQLNAEKAAEREKLEEQKRVEREKQKLEKQMEDEEKKQLEREKKRELTSAIISAALATSNAYATTPFLPVDVPQLTPNVDDTLPVVSAL